MGPPGCTERKRRKNLKDELMSEDIFHNPYFLVAIQTHCLLVLPKNPC